MAKCGSCGVEIQEGVAVCPQCGAPVAAESAPEQPSASQTVADAFNKFTNTADTTAQFDAQDVQNNKVMAVLSYIGILVLIPLFAAKESPYARYHANQGLVLFLAELVVGVVLSIVGVILGFLWLGWLVGLVSSLCWLLFLVLAILGIVNAAQGQAKELPIIGSIRILK